MCAPESDNNWDVETPHSNSSTGLGVLLRVAITGMLRHHTVIAPLGWVYS